MKKLYLIVKSKIIPVKNAYIEKKIKALFFCYTKVGSFSYEPNAFKFGDGPNSHSIITIVNSRKMWQKNFNIEFDFRTFYPNGVLFIAPVSMIKVIRYLNK